MYDKYKKVKASADPNKTLNNVSKYINDDEKTVYSSKAALDYISNEAKTYEAERKIRLVSGHMCDADTAVREFEIARKRYYATKDEWLNPGQTPIQAYHLISSFKGQVDPELAHKIGREFCEILLGNSFQAVVCTHINTANTHNHILVNAYAIDGIYKFKDEFHLYRKLRTISNELSLKYGIPLYMGDEKTKSSYRYTTWAELLDKDYFKEQKEKFKQDIKDTSDMCSDYDSFIELMKEKGYICKQNKNSTTFKSPELDLSFRDNTLGAEFTRDGLQKKWDSAAKKEERRIIMEKVNQLRKENLMKYRKYDSVLVPRWDDLGNRIGLLKRLLLVIKNLIEQIGDDYYSVELEEMNPENRNFQSSFKKLANINRTIELLDYYEIKTEVGLQDKITLTGMDLSTAKMEYNSAKGYVAAAESVIKDIEKMNEYETILREANVPYESIVIAPPTSEEIRKNLASLEPMNPKLLYRLSQKLHGCKWTVAVPFTHISSSEAKEILAYLDSETSNNPLPKPDILLSKESYFARKTIPLLLHDFVCPKAPLPAHKLSFDRADRPPQDQYKILVALKKAYPDIFCNIIPANCSARDAKKIIETVTTKEQTPRQTFVYSTLSPVLKDIVKKYRLLKEDMLEYGINDKESADAFIEKYHTMQSDLQRLSDEVDAKSETYRDLRFIERTLSDIQKPAYVYGPVFSGQPEELNESKSNLGSAKLDHLFEVQKLLVDVVRDVDLSTLSKSPIGSSHFVPPSPEVKSVLRDVQAFLPNPINVNTISEYEALYLLNELVEQQKIEDEIKKLTTLEQEQEAEETKTHEVELFEKFLERKMK